MDWAQIEDNQNISSVNREDNLSGRDWCQSDNAESSLSRGEKGPLNQNQHDVMYFSYIKLYSAIRALFS